MTTSPPTSPADEDGPHDTRADAPEEGADTAASADDTAAEAGEPTGADVPAQPVLTPIPTSAASDDAQWLIELPEFEGPLDLLLHLVRRHELEILDIPISFVCEKYLEYLDLMRALDLEVAGEYLVMAATLAYLKSRELIPTQAEETAEDEASREEGPDPREELIARLLEYQKYRAAADQLDALPVSGRDVFDRGGAVELPPVDPGLAPITLFRLAEAFHRVLERARIHKSHEVVLETVSVSQRMEQLTDILIERPKIEFEWLFLRQEWPSESYLRSMLVVTLMSLLELTRMGIVRVHQEPEQEGITIERVASPEDAKRALAGFDEQVAFGSPEEAAKAEAHPAEPTDEDGDGEGSADEASLLAAIERSLEAMERRSAGGGDDETPDGEAAEDDVFGDASPDVAPPLADEASEDEALDGGSPENETALDDDAREDDAAVEDNASVEDDGDLEDDMPPREIADASDEAWSDEPERSSHTPDPVQLTPATGGSLDDGDDERPAAAPPQNREESAQNDDSALASSEDSSDALPPAGPTDED